MAKKVQKEGSVEAEVGSGNVFADLGMANAYEHKVKADLVARIQKIIKAKGLTQAQAGKLLGMHQPDVSKLFRGHYRGYSIEKLIRFLLALGRDIEIVVRPKPSRANRESSITVRTA